MDDVINNPVSNTTTARKSSFWRGFVDAFLGPKNQISGLRRRFSSKSWATRFSFLLIAAVIISGFATYAALTETPPFGDDPDTVIWLLNLDLIILLLLATLIARRIVSIWSGRRRNIAGSRLHVRLVLIFSIMAAVPAIIMAVFSAFFFHFGVQTWFSENVRTAVVESQAVAEAYLEEHQQVIKADILAMANDIDRQAAMMMDPQAAYDRSLDTQSLLRNLSEAMIFDRVGKILSRSSLTFTLTFENVPDYILEQAQDGEVVVLNSDNDDRLRALVRLNSGNNNFLFVGRRVDPVVLSHLAATKNATDRYTQLEGSYSGLQITVTMIFVMVALLLLLAAMWVGIVLARQLVTPISTLISVSDRVRAGDLTVRVPKQDQIEEFDYVAQSFNRMTAQLQQQRDELVNANRQLDHRRRLTETVLAGVSAGVVGVDSQGKITLANSMAGEMFEQDSQSLIGKKIKDIAKEIGPLLEKANTKPEKITQAEIPFVNSEGQKLILTVRIAIERIGEEEHGAVLTFDDITELQSAQRKAAWADVARRIAHEIKNPLTPIQLSAERLRRKYLDEITSDRETFEICTDTIIHHVGDIGRMVNEFSDFARMPEALMKPTRIISELQDLITFQKAAHPDIIFNFKGNLANQRDFVLRCDSQQIRQAVTNLIQNALDSIQTRISKEEGFKGQLDIIFHREISKNKENQLFIVLNDNGLGLPEGQDPSKLSEPYVTHRERGTGLGLAIVKKIMQDHEGQLVIGANNKIKDIEGWNDLGGASVSLILPILEQKQEGALSDNILQKKKA
ncbi:MAG TPA: PAS domain-containing sensor histidine kinase [Alphaproteobacteria bacterium]|nr:PAS domain-containing sensor histidine kinase [Alphaproteobacteria bacterium]